MIIGNNTTGNTTISSRMCTNVNVSNFIHWLEKRDIPFVCFGSDKKQFLSYLIQSPADSFTYQSFSYRELKEISCSYCPTALIHIIAPRSAITLPPHSACFDIFFTITSHIRCPQTKKPSVQIWIAQIWSLMPGYFNLFTWNVVNTFN